METGIGRAALSGVRWTAIGKFSSQLIRTGTTLIVIRLLSEEDYGVFALGSLLLNFLMVFSSEGLMIALIQKRDLSVREYREMQGAILGIALVFATGLFLAAPLIADFYNEPRVVATMRALSLAFLISAATVIPSARLNREMRFKHKAVAEFLATCATAALALVVAYMGFGYWALVIGMLTELLAFCIVFAIICPPPLPAIPSREILSLLRFGGVVTVTRTLWFIAVTADIAIAGRAWDSATLGFYVVALNLATMPLSKTMNVLIQVVLASISKMQTEIEQVRAHLLRGLPALTWLILPIFVGLAAVGDFMIPVVIGENWIPSASPFMVLALFMPVRMLVELMSPVVEGLGNPRLVMSNNAVLLVFVIVGLLFGVGFGPPGLAAGLAIAYVCGSILVVMRSFRFLGLRASDLWSMASVPVLCAVAMLLTVRAIGTYVFDGQTSVWALCSLIAAGAVVYLGLGALLARDAMTSSAALAFK